MPATREDAGRDDLLGQCVEDAPEHEEVDGLVLEAEQQVVGQPVAGPVALVEHRPRAVGAAASADVPVGDAARMANRHRLGQLMNKRGGPDQTRSLRNGLLLERRRLGSLEPHVEKPLCTSNNINKLTNTSKQPYND